MKTTLLILLVFCSSATADELSALCADRLAIERVYYNHRLGDKPPFEKTMPPALVERLVKQDLHKEAVLKNVYDVEITPALLDAEVQRINHTTRAPEMLAEIKAALGDDPARFARAVARPIVVERVLRDRFENDDTLHAPERHEVEKVREQLLAAKARGASATNLLAWLGRDHARPLSGITWQLGARQAETNAPDPDLIEAQRRFGPEARILSAPGAGAERKLYFEDLPGELQTVLRVQLRQAGDVSAVIETPGGFALYLAKDKTTNSLAVGVWPVPKRSYEQWLNEQTESNP